MPEVNPVSELRSLISYEEQRILNSFLLERRTGLMEISRSMDFYCASLNMGFLQNPEQFNELELLISFGLNKAIYLFLDHSCSFPSFPLSCSNEQDRIWANAVLNYCGHLGLCEHLLEINRIGLCELNKESEHVYRFEYSSNIPIGLESFERDDFSWYSQFINHKQHNRRKELETRQRKIWDIMSDLVDTWHTHYIQYEAHPEVDQFYQEHGILLNEKMFVHNCFPKDVKFGGYDFDLYQKAVGSVTGWALKHTSFCTQLFKKNRQINLRNIITVPQNFDDLVIFLTHQLDIDFEAAKHLLETLTLTNKNKNIHCATSGDLVSPAFIEVGQGRVISTIWGKTIRPFKFMLDEIKRKYRSDWDRAVDRREVMFRSEIYALFSSSKFFKFDGNINIKIGGSTMTDIDALILDRSTGILAIFQLKWQDSFGNSMRERESRKRNLLKTGNQWVDRVSHWLEENSISEISKLCRLNQDDAKRVNGFRLFVIGRNATHFSGLGNLDPRAAWGTWYQMLRLFTESVSTSNPLDELYELMIQDSPLKKPPLKLPPQELQIGNVRIITSFK